MHEAPACQNGSAGWKDLVKGSEKLPGLLIYKDSLNIHSQTEV